MHCKRQQLQFYSETLSVLVMETAAWGSGSTCCANCVFTKACMEMYWLLVVAVVEAAVPAGLL